MLSDTMGPAQTAALRVLLQGDLAEPYSEHTTRHLFKGAWEEGRYLRRRRGHAPLLDRATCAARPIVP
jgi:hypothetical protein